MSITLDDVLCLIHLSIKGKLLNYYRTTKTEALEMMVIYLGVDPEKTHQELDDTRGYHSRFSFLVDLHKHHLDASMEAMVMMHMFHTT